MRIKRFLVHSCTLITPGVVTGQDPYGRDIYGEDEQPNLPCRVDQIRKRATQDEYGTDYVTQNMLFLAPGVNVKNESRFKNFKDSQGNTILEGEYQVEQITPSYKRKALNHYEVALTEVS